MAEPDGRTTQGLLARRFFLDAGTGSTAGGARPCAAGVHLGPHGLVYDVWLELGAEDGLFERHVLRLLPGGVEEGCFRHGHLTVILPVTVSRLWRASRKQCKDAGSARALRPERD